MYQGREYVEAPVALITNAILREVDGGVPSESSSREEPYTMPENLERFFAGKSATERGKASADLSCCEDEVTAACCPPTGKDYGC